MSLPEEDSSRACREREADVVVVAERVQRLTSALQRARVATTGASPTTGRVGR